VDAFPISLGWWSHDLGGFHNGTIGNRSDVTGDEDPKSLIGSEMYLRWLQFGAVRAAPPLPLALPLCLCLCPLSLPLLHELCSLPSQVMCVGLFCVIATVSVAGCNTRASDRMNGECVCLACAQLSPMFRTHCNLDDTTAASGCNPRASPDPATGGTSSGQY
jgi:hypothetical protein